MDVLTAHLPFRDILLFFCLPSGIPPPAVFIFHPAPRLPCRLPCRVVHPSSCLSAFRFPLFALFKLSALTGINHRVLAENNAQCFREVWPRFAEWLTAIGGQEEGDAGETGGGYVLIAHNAAFDHKFLVEEQARGGFDK